MIDGWRGVLGGGRVEKPEIAGWYGRDMTPKDSGM